MPMQKQDRQPPVPGLSLADIYYIIFRHKWKILTLSTAGLVTAALLYLLEPPVYTSEAKLFIRYVVEARLPSVVDGESQIKTPDPGGANIINSEVEILKSLDLASQVVDAIGPEKLLGKGNGQTNKYLAAIQLIKNLSVEVPPRSDILRISFQNRNREVVQPVLEQLINAYLRKHVEIHNSVGALDDVLTQQTDALRNQLAQTEADLRRAKTNAGLLDVEEAKKTYADELGKIQEQLFNTQAELAERQAALEERQKLQPLPEVASTNQAGAPMPAGKLDEYRSLCERLATFRKREQDLLSQFTEENALVRNIRAQITEAESQRRSLEIQYPKLAQLQLPSAQTGSPGHDWSDEEAQITALKAKLDVLNTQRDRINAQAKSINELEPAITELQRRRDIEEAKYRHFSTSLEQAHFDEALNAGKMSNISVAQAPSPAFRESRQLLKTVGLVAAGGVGGGLALAFLLELFFDSTVRRPSEVESRLRLPLFLTIPDTRKNGHLALPEPAAELTTPGGQPAPAVAPPGAVPAGAAGEVVTWHPNNNLRPYYEALRDRLVTYFEVTNLTRKPKLVAVTGCGPDAGVSTIATGLAASLSETGDGNVLLVDMTSGQGAAHAFFRGKPACGLADALEGEKRDGAMVHENLYVVAEGGEGDKLPRMLPRRFHNLVPKLKASDYDYIIFDMPPVSQISITPRLAGFMDMVLMVIESEKTDREVLKRAAAMLADSKATVSAVLNKTHRYVPKALEPEL